MSKFKIFIASPSDVIEERDIVSNIVVPELRRVFGDNQFFEAKTPLDLEAIRWETHTWPDVGDDAQDVINREIGTYDVLVGILWRRFGTPTKRASSGTGEEFERAYNYYKAYGRPKIMFYFRTTPFYTTTPAELSQFKKVINFRSKLQKLGVLFWEYQSVLEFERDVREHLIRQISQFMKVSQRSVAVGSKRKQPKAKKRQESEKSARQRLRRKVFLAYARHDLDAVRSIYHSLRESGFQPWLDVEALLPGQDWLSNIEKAISESATFLVFISKNSVRKDGYVQREVTMALSRVDRLKSGEGLIIPVRLEPVEPPPYLSRYQWIDYFVEGGPERLIQTLKEATSEAGRRLRHH